MLRTRGYSGFGLPRLHYLSNPLRLTSVPKVPKYTRFLANKNRRHMRAKSPGHINCWDHIQTDRLIEHDRPRLEGACTCNRARNKF